LLQFFKTEKGVYVLLTLTAILWGGNAVAAKYTVGQLAPSTTAFFRFAWVSVILVSLAFYIEGRRCLPRFKQLPGIIAMGITGIFMHNFFTYSGVKLSSATNMSLLNALNPVITACLAAIFLKEHLTLRQLSGIAVSFLGVGIVITKGDWMTIIRLSFNQGDILLALAPVCWALYSIAGRKVMRGMTALAATAWAGIFGSLILLFFAWGEGFGGLLNLNYWGWVSMLYMIIGSGFFAFLWWNQGVAVIGPNRAAIFTNIIPVSGMIFAALLVNETIACQQFAGAALIISGVCLTTQKGAPKLADNKTDDNLQFKERSSSR